MKVELNSTIIGEKITKFPSLGISGNNTVVLFHEKECGIVVSKGDGGWKVGDYRKVWNMDCFTLFKGAVTLSNE